MRKATMILIAGLFFSWMSIGFAEGLKMGFIDLKKVLDTYEKVKEGETQLLKQAQEKTDQREKLVTEIKGIREKLELLKDKEKEKKQQELDAKLKQLQDFTYQSRTTLEQSRDDKFREIMKEVQDVVAEYGQSRNFNIIIDDTLILYKDKTMDVTDDIIKTLNQRYKK